VTDTLTRPGPTRAGTSEEDPRIARRRKDVVAERRHRRRVVAAWIGAAVALLAALFGLTRSPLLDVDRVVVSGGDHVENDQVVRASGIRTGDALVGVDVAAARTAVMALPGVASARVEREWPDAVRIVVTDEVPVAVLVASGQSVVVARGGRIIGAAPSSKDPSQLTGASVLAADGVAVATLKAGDQVPDLFAPAVVALEQMSGPLRAATSSVEVAADGSLTLTLRDDSSLGVAGGHIELGSPDGLPAKLLSASSMVAAARMACLDVLDVREPSRPTITRSAGCDSGQPTVGAPTVPGAAGTTKPTTTVPRSTTTVPAGQAGTAQKSTGQKSTTTTQKSTSSTQKSANTATTATGPTTRSATSVKGNR